MKAVADIAAEGFSSDASAFAATASPSAVLPFHCNAGGALTLTNQANAEQYLGNTGRNETYFDSTNFTQVRVVANVATISASINIPRLYPQYNLGAGWVTVGDGGIVSGNALDLATPTGVKRGTWITVPTAAKTDCRWRIAQNGGDGVADPVLGMVALQFR